jgi:hypothetical protein
VALIDWIDKRHGGTRMKNPNTPPRTQISLNTVEPLR